MKRLGLLWMVMMFAVLFAVAAEVWESKPYTQWSAKDVRQVTSESPWAHTFVLRSPNMTQIRREFGKLADRAGEGEGTMNPEVDYVISVRTALPVREAVVRAAALQANYDRMEAAAREAFDANWAKYLNARPSDKVIFNVQYSASATNVDRELASYWQSQTLDSVKLDAYMTGPDGKRVEPIAFFVGKGASREFQLAFPRPAEDFPKNSAVAVEFKHPDVTEQPSARVYTKFNLKDMTYKGKLTY